MRPSGHQVITASKFEEIVERLLGAARFFRVAGLARCGRGFTFPRGAAAEQNAVIRDVLWRHSSRNALGALVGRARIEIHALHARPQLDLALRALAARHDFRLDDRAAARTASDLARAHHARVARAFRRDAPRPGWRARLTIGTIAAALGTWPGRLRPVSVVVLV